MAEIFGIDVAELPESYIPTGAIVLIRGIDSEDGLPFMATRVSQGIGMPEVVGMAWTFHEDTKMQLMDGMVDRETE